MIDTRVPVDAHELIATEYTRRQIASAIDESVTEAFQLRAGGLSREERDWVHRWLGKAVPMLTDRTVEALEEQLQSGLWSAPRQLLESATDRRRRAALGLE
jgi:hypothetical protein